MKPDGINFQQRDQKRGAWLEALRKEKTITKARKTISPVYFWLYRNDRAWLKESLPPRMKPKAAASRVDWKQREDVFCSSLSSARESLLDRDPLILCSATALLREIGGYQFYSYLDKMPRLEAELSVLGETRTAFAIRRLGAARALLGSGATPRALFVEAKLKSDLWQNREIRQYLGLSE